MRAVDTSALVDLLRGNPRAGQALRAGDPPELATTELVFAELGALARLDPSAGREKRLAALDRLRRHLTVLPIDARSSRTAGEIWARAPKLPAWFVLNLGILEASNVFDWVVRLPAGQLTRSLTRVKLLDYR